MAASRRSAAGERGGIARLAERHRSVKPPPERQERVEQRDSRAAEVGASGVCLPLGDLHAIQQRREMLDIRRLMGHGARHDDLTSDAAGSALRGMLGGAARDLPPVAIGVREVPRPPRRGLSRS